MASLDTAKLRARAWAYTIHNYADLPELKRVVDSVYQVFGYEECPLTQRPHIQGFVYFENTRTMSAVKKAFNCNTMSLSVMYKHSTPEANRVYCTKCENFEEYGVIPQQGKRNDLSDVRDLVRDGANMAQIVEVATSYQSLRAGEMLLKYLEQTRKWKTHVIWVYGPPGCGKTRLAFEALAELYGVDPYVKNPRTKNWWDGYDGNEGVVLDEVDADTSYATLKELSDRYPSRIETKGGVRQFLAKTMYITSLSDPAKLFAHKPYGGREILRRIDEIIILGDSIGDADQDDQDHYLPQEDEDHYPGSS